MSRVRTRVISLFMLNILACSCVSRTTVHHGVNPAASPYKQVQAASLGDYIRAVNELSHENSVKHEQERAALLSSAPELAALSTRAEQNPADRESVLRLATAYLDHDLYWSAYELLAPLQIAIPNETEIDINLSRIWDAWGQFDLARQHAERAIANGAAASPAFELLGRIHLHRNSPAEAIAAFLRANQAGPDRPAVLANLGYAYMVQQEWPKARVYLEQAVKLDRSFAEAQNNLAMVLSQLGDQSGALRQLQETSRPAVALNNMGVLFLRQKRLAEAQNSFRASLLLEPAYENALRNFQSVRALLPQPSSIELPASAAPSTSQAAATPPVVKPVMSPQVAPRQYQKRASPTKTLQPAASAQSPRGLSRLRQEAPYL